VRPLEDAGSGLARHWKLQALREGWAWAPRQWARVTDDTGVGDPSGGTAEKGAAYFATVTEKLAEYITEVASADLHDLYE
jgi:creatinine amidohydrolase